MNDAPTNRQRKRAERLRAKEARRTERQKAEFKRRRELRRRLRPATDPGFLRALRQQGGNLPPLPFDDLLR